MAYGLSRTMCYFRHGAYVRLDEGAYYRIVADKTLRKDIGTVTYTCEHCIATLSDDLMFGSYEIGGDNTPTRNVINSILAHQERGNPSAYWTLDACDFDHRHKYILESETLLSALWAVTDVFPEPHVWTYDFSTFPWKLSLRLINQLDAPEFYIRAEKNLLSSDVSRDTYDVCTRLYALGNGEGVNQIRIGKVNSGKDYIQSPQAYIDKYGIISKLFVDKRYETPEILLAAAQAALNECQEPKYTRKFNVVDLEKLTRDKLDSARIGKIVRLTEDDTATYITAITRNHDVAGDMQIELSTRLTSLEDTLANLANQQRIEQLYGQGATIVYGESLQTNADTGNAAEIKLNIPSEMKYVNKVYATLKLEPYRTYSKGAAAGGGSTSSSTPNGATPTQTPTSGNPTNPVKTSSSGGETRVTKADTTGTGHTDYGDFVYTDYATPPTSGSHRHRMYHWHDLQLLFDIPAHYHTVNIDNHQHPTTVAGADNHTHITTTPAHTHPEESGIQRSGNPKNGKVFVNGVQRTVFFESATLDITEYLKNAEGIVPRDKWITVGVLPDDKAYITIDVMIQGFVQARGGGSY